MTSIALAVLVDQGRVLLGHRSPGRRHYPDCWDVVGGHVESGESAESAMVRECREEIGVRVRQFRAVPVDLADPALTAHAYLVTGWVGTPTNTAPDEHDRLGWFGAHELSPLRLAHPSYLQWLTGLLARA